MSSAIIYTLAAVGEILIGMGTLHAWETYGDGISVSFVYFPASIISNFAQPDIQAVAKGLGGGWVSSVTRNGRF